MGDCSRMELWDQSKKSLKITLEEKNEVYPSDLGMGQESIAAAAP